MRLVRQVVREESAEPASALGIHTQNAPNRTKVKKSFNKGCDKGFHEDTERAGWETSEFRLAYYALTSANLVGNVAVQFFWLWPELGAE